MSYYGFNHPPTESEYQANEEQWERYYARRAAARREMDCYPWEDDHMRDEADFEPENFVPVLAESGVTREEGEAFLTWIDRKPAQVARMQMELFPQEVA